MRRFSSILLVSMAPLVVTLVVTAVAMAHADYVRSEPAADSTVASAPAEIRIWFTQELFRRVGENGIEVYDPDGQQVEAGDATIDDDDRTLMSVELQPDLQPGSYTVRWYTLSSVDGHPGEGEFVFSIGEATDLASIATISVTVEADPTAIAPADAVEAEAPAAQEAEPEGDTQASTEQATPVPEAGVLSSLPCVGSSTLLLLALGAVWRQWRDSFNRAGLP